ncbi:MAG: CBS domain-containing protein [Syntrophaceae bacterium]|nr:CBS domain-containing protein [Syntrophaceae bacterium]
MDYPILKQHYLSDLLTRVVVSVNDEILGSTSDFVIDLDKPQPEVIALIFRKKWSTARFSVKWHNVTQLSENKIILKESPIEPEALKNSSYNGPLVLLREFLLDKQIVDVYGAKVERVNDLKFVESDGKLFLIQVDVGLMGLLRRLGFERPVSRFCKWFFDYDLKEKFIAWNYVEPLVRPDHLLLQVPQTRLSELHPADLADIIEDMDVNERSALVNSLTEEVIAEALEEMDPKVQVAIMRRLDPEKAADIIEEMSPDEAADLIADLPQETATGIFREMDDEYEEKVKGLLVHDEDEAGGLMTTQFITLSPNKTIVEALAHIRQNAEDMDVIYYIYVVDEESRLLGVVNLRELLSQEIFTPLSEIMTTRLITAKLDDPAKDLAYLFAKYGFRGVPVVDDENHIAGVVRFKALLEILAPHLGK